MRCHSVPRSDSMTSELLDLVCELPVRASLWVHLTETGCLIIRHRLVLLYRSSMSFRDSRPSTPTPKPFALPITPSTPVNDILAAFQITPSPSRIFPISPASLLTHHIIMTDKAKGRSLRQIEPKIYAISDDSDAVDSGSAVESSAFGSPVKLKRGRPKTINLDDDTEDDDAEPEMVEPPRERVSTAGHSLRPHKNLKLSLQALENGDKPTKKKKKKLTQRRSYKLLPKLTSDLANAAPRTTRNAIRDSIASATAAKRAKFFIAKKDLFLPLLPEHNHIAKLVDQQCHHTFPSSPDDDVSIAEYEALEEQPKG